MTHIFTSVTAVFDAEFVDHRRVDATMGEFGGGWHRCISEISCAAAKILVEQRLGYSIGRVANAYT